MTKPHLSRARNADQRASYTALKRAASLARKTAIQTNTGIIICRDGQPVRITAAELREGGE
jgi:hypothetical protein